MFSSAPCNREAGVEGRGGGGGALGNQLQFLKVVRSENGY